VVHHIVHGGNITIHARHNAYGYFALLYADIMRKVLIRIQTYGGFTVIQINDAAILMLETTTPAAN